VQFPWQSQPHCVIKIEITTDEAVLLPPRSLPLLHPYGEGLSCLLLCYSLEEVVAEKLRTPLQAQKRADEGRWLRNCARDYYDLWCLTSPGRASVSQNVVGTILRQKLSARGVDFRSPDDFFPSAVLTEAERQWRSSLADLVGYLPEFATAIGELRHHISNILAGLDGS
jgi:predicted nucleotidyltransferase component of viral defense system